MLGERLPRRPSSETALGRRGWYAPDTWPKYEKSLLLNFARHFRVEIVMHFF